MYDARSPLRGLLAPYGALCEHCQHLMSPKPTGFASFRRCQLAGGEVWAGLWVWWSERWVLWSGVGVLAWAWCDGRVFGEGYGGQSAWTILGRAYVNNQVLVRRCARNQPCQLWENIGWTTFWRR